MGGKFSILENKSNVDMEIRVFIPPARPDHYRKIIRIKPGETKLVKMKHLFCRETVKDSEINNPTFFMVFMDGIYSGVSLFPCDITKYAKILGYVDQNTGNVRLKGIKTRFSCCLILKYIYQNPFKISSFFLGKMIIIFLKNCF